MKNRKLEKNILSKKSFLSRRKICSLFSCLFFSAVFALIFDLFFLLPSPVSALSPTPMPNISSCKIKLDILSCSVRDYCIGGAGIFSCDFLDTTSFKAVKCSIPQVEYYTVSCDTIEATEYYCKVGPFNKSSWPPIWYTGAWLGSCASPSPTPVLACPSVKAYCLSTSSVRVYWNGVSGAYSYRVYRDGLYKANVTTNGYTDTGVRCGVQHTYNVNPFPSGGKEKICKQNTKIFCPCPTKTLPLPR